MPLPLALSIFLTRGAVLSVGEILNFKFI